MKGPGRGRKYLNGLHDRIVHARGLGGVVDTIGHGRAKVFGLQPRSERALPSTNGGRRPFAYLRQWQMNQAWAALEPRRATGARGGTQWCKCKQCGGAELEGRKECASQKQVAGGQRKIPGARGECVDQAAYSQAERRGFAVNVFKRLC
jgi:hypothetical protein